MDTVFTTLESLGKCMCVCVYVYTCLFAFCSYNAGIQLMILM